MTILDEMRPKLHSVAELRTMLGRYEPMSQHVFPTNTPSPAKFNVSPDWFHEDHPEDQAMDNAEIRIGASTYQLTPAALCEAASMFGIPKGYTQKVPARFLVDQLNYWFSAGASEIKALSTDTTVQAFVRPTLQPFSNTELLNQVVASFDHVHGLREEDLLVDYKCHNNMHRTHFRVINPASHRTIESRRGTDDVWSEGVEVRNSLVGREATELHGYLFAWICTNGQTSNLVESGAWKRRSGQGDEVYEWARAAVDEILGGLDHEWDALQALADQPQLDDVNNLLRDMFETYRIPVPAREAIVNNMVESDDLSAYGVLNALTEAANDPAWPAHVQTHLLEVGGHLPHALSDRCPECRRVKL